MYDDKDQLIRENDQTAGKTWVYAYNGGGNITSKKEYAYTTGTLGTVQSTKTYSYGSTAWKDKLTSYDGNTLSYDSMGNLTSDGEWTYTWQHGSQLSGMTKTGTTAAFEYNADGLRTQKTVNGTTTKYFYAGDQLTFVNRSGNKLHFVYDSIGPVTVTYNSTVYYYLRNAQGDITGITDNTGAGVVYYFYDAWGNPTSVSGSMANTLGKYNPFRYRGYVYDEETGLYYLNSRYYDPELCRFISADSLAVPTISPGSASWDKNLYAYCDNNPVNRKDAGGGCWQAVAIGFGFGIIGQYVSDVIGNIQSGKTGLDILTPSSSGGDYLFAGLGGAVAAISIGSALGTATFGAFGNLLTEGAQGNIKSHTDLFASCVRGAAYGSIGYLASNVFAFKNVRNIDKMTRSSKKSFLRDIIYKSPQKKVNVNYHVYMEKSVLSKITVIKENVISYKLGIHSTVASTAASVFIRARMTA